MCDFLDFRSDLKFSEICSGIIWWVARTLIFVGSATFATTRASASLTTVFWACTSQNDMFSEVPQIRHQDMQLIPVHTHAHTHTPTNARKPTRTRTRSRALTHTYTHTHARRACCSLGRQTIRTRAHAHPRPPTQTSANTRVHSPVDLAFSPLFCSTVDMPRRPTVTQQQSQSEFLAFFLLRGISWDFFGWLGELQPWFFLWIFLWIFFSRHVSHKIAGKKITKQITEKFTEKFTSAIRFVNGEIFTKKIHKIALGKPSQWPTGPGPCSEARAKILSVAYRHWAAHYAYGSWFRTGFRSFYNFK